MNRNSIMPIDFNELWREGIYNWEGQIPERMSSDVLEQEFWQNFINDRQLIYNPPLHVKTMQKEISKLIDEGDHVLELGAGWGDYTVPIAQKCGQISCVDISLDNLTYTQKLVEEYAKKDVEIFPQKWEDFNQNRHYDVIVGVNCFYRMFNLKECILNMIKHANKRVILAITTGPIQEYYQEIHDTLGYEIKVPKRDYIFILNILYQMGIYANCNTVKLTKNYYYRSMDEALENCKRKIVDENVDGMKVKSILKKYLQKTEENKYVYIHRFHGVIIDFEK